MDEHDTTQPKPRYKSKQGFETVPLLRGFDQIRPLWRLIEDTRAATQKDCFICGGYARYCASPRRDVVDAGDVDVYCETQEVFDHIFKTLKDKGLEIKHENDVSVTWAVQKEGELAYVPVIQLIKPVLEGRIVAAGDRQTILENFDFTVIRAAIVSPESVMVDADFLHDEGKRILRLKNIHCPISSTLRCMKYARKGYWLRPLECLKLFIDWSDRGEEYRQKLIDFLQKADEGDGLTQEEVDELEALMRID